MKPKILKLSTVVLLLLFIGASCQKDEIEYADENIVVSNFPGVYVYKTKGNYINYIALQITPQGNLNAIPDFTYKEDSRIIVDEKGKAQQNFRWRLKSGYIVDSESSIRDVFTNITISEYVDYNSKNGVACWPHNLIEKRIIDYDPFIELYHMGCLDCPIKEFTLKEINDMIENGTIEEHFTKLK